MRPFLFSARERDRSAALRPARRGTLSRSTWGGVTMRILALTAVLAGCSTEHFPFPDMQRIVNDSLPSALQPGATTPMARLAPANDTSATLDMLALKSIRNMFQDSYLDGELGGPGHGGLVAGYLNAQISN